MHKTIVQELNFIILPYFFLAKNAFQINILWIASIFLENILPIP